VGATGL